MFGDQKEEGAGKERRSGRQVPGLNGVWQTSTRRLGYVLIAVGAHGEF